MLLALLRKSSTSVSICRRIKIILHFNSRADYFTTAALELKHNRATVKTWYQRGSIINCHWDNSVKLALNETGRAGNKLRKLRLAEELLLDNPRIGTPAKFTAEQYTAIVKLALEKPEDFQRPVSHWTARELTDEVHKQNIAPGISQRQVQRFLSQAELKPHKSKYWLNPKIENIEEYEQQVKEICSIYTNAEVLNSQGINIISTDEKTGMQALERKHAAKPMRAGKEELIEAEYIRHGTLCLIPSFNVATGKIVENYIGETRDEKDFAEHIRKTVSGAPDSRWIFICDQLNIHASETLVRIIAKLIGFKGELGKKRKTGILKDLKSRKEFLTNKEHQICFVYTPKHCSWLNQVEIWFGILARKVLKRGNFLSKEDLAEKLKSFIEYFNATMAKPFKWTYKGKPLSA